MPLTVKDYTWTQTETTVYISIPLKGVKTSKVDVLCTDEYLKPIDDDKSVARIGNGAAVFTLPKKEGVLWERLCRSVEKDKQRESREEAILKTQKKHAERSKAKSTKAQQEKKFTLETMMKLEEDERKSIQRMKDEECAKATAELEVWKQKQRETEEEEEEARRRTRGDTMHDGKHIHQRQQPDETYMLRPVQQPCRTQGEMSNRAQARRAGPAGPRETGCIKISFTPRVFPTALRESRVHEEEEWLMKQAEARRAANADLAQLEDLKEEERNPDWLKNKGDTFFRLGNFQAAVNAYDLAIRLNRAIPALFSNRAACHLKMRNLHKAVEDSSRALELLTPAVTDNAAARVKAHVRRGTAFCELELFVEGLQDYQAALRIDPHNLALQADASKICEIVQGTAPSSSGGATLSQTFKTV